MSHSAFSSEPFHSPEGWLLPEIQLEKSPSDKKNSTCQEMNQAYQKNYYNLIRNITLVSHMPFLTTVITIKI